jgi:tetratricopeptide (TPR) repeat protein
MPAESSCGTPCLHLCIAEQGKLLALAGKHTDALHYYREAMHIAVSQKAPEVFFRHYLECSLEALELMGSYDEVIQYCEKAIEHYKQIPADSSIRLKDLASIHQRRGVVLAKRGKRAQAQEALTQAIDVARMGGFKLPLAVSLLGWLSSELHITNERIEREQKRYGYFSVRKDTVDPGRALVLPQHTAPSDPRVSR